MNFEEWRYEWIKAAIRNYVPVETALKAFDQSRTEAAGVDLKSDPALACHRFLTERFLMSSE